MSYRIEFPDYPEDTHCTQLVALGFADVSWRNDACPSFEAMELRVWIDWENVEWREIGPHRFAVGYWGDGGESGDLFVSDDWSAVLEFLAAYRVEYDALPEWMRRPISSALDADTFIRAACKSGHQWHMDDSPIGVPSFTRAEMGTLAQRKAEVDMLRVTSSYEPHGLCIFRTNGMPPAWLELDDWLCTHFDGAGLDTEQRDCLESSARIDEARDMLDDMQVRLGVPPSLIALCLIALDGARAWE